MYFRNDPFLFRPQSERCDTSGELGKAVIPTVCSVTLSYEAALDLDRGMLIPRSSHYWSWCPMTCTRCEAKRHTAKYCEEFSLSPSGISRPRPCNPLPPTEPASHRARKESLEHAHGEDSLPKRPEKIVLPNHGLVKDSEGTRLRASRNVFDPNFEDTRRVPQQSGPIEKGASSPTDRPLQGLREPKRSSSPRSRTTSTSQQLTISTQAPGRLATPPSTQPSISPLDPRLRRGPALTPLVSPLQSLKMSLEPGEIPSVEPQMLGEPPSNPSQHRPLEVGATPSRASVQHEQYPSQACGRREAYVPSTSSWKEDRYPRAPDQKHQTTSQDPTRNEGPVLPASTLNERSASDHLDTLEARLEAFEEEERIKQKEHEEELARKARRQKMEYEHELEEMINQKKHDADMARKAAVMKQAEEHERRLAELRRR